LIFCPFFLVLRRLGTLVELSAVSCQLSAFMLLYVIEAEGNDFDDDLKEDFFPVLLLLIIPSRW
jgi:hypothetical protein